MQLIYHTKKSQEGGVSPFHKHISSLFTSISDVKIMCPYIDLHYLKPFLLELNSYKILTDITELLNSKSSNLGILDELIESKSIKHIKNLHAKILLSSEKVILGSANFTKKGLTKNLELSIFINDLNLVKELNSWFDDNWDKGNELKFSDVNKYSTQINPKEIQSPIPDIWKNSFINSSFSSIDKLYFNLNSMSYFPKKYKKLPNKVIKDFKVVIESIEKFIQENNIAVILGSTKAGHSRFNSNFKVEKCNNPITFIPKTSKNRVKVFFRVYSGNEKYIDENTTESDLNEILKICFSLLKRWKVYS